MVEEFEKREDKFISGLRVRLYVRVEADWVVKRLSE